MEISYVVLAPNHFSATSGSDCELLPACLCSQWEHFFQPCQQLLFSLWGGQRLSLTLVIKKPMALKRLLFAPCQCMSELQSRMRANKEIWFLLAPLPAADEQRWCWEKGCCCGGVLPRAAHRRWPKDHLKACSGLHLCWQHWGCYRNESLPLIWRFWLPFLPSFDVEVCMRRGGVFMGFLQTCTTLHWRPGEEMGESEPTPTLSSCSPQPKAQELQVSQIVCSQKLKGNQPHSFLR